MKKNTRKRKPARKYSVIEASYNAYKREFGKAMRAKKLLKDESMMSFEDYYANAVSAGASFTSGDKELFDPAKMRELSARAIAAATGTLTSNQAKALKREMIRMVQSGATLSIDLKGREITDISITEIRNNKALLSDFYKYLLENGVDPEDARSIISAEIFGS